MFSSDVAIQFLTVGGVAIALIVAVAWSTKSVIVHEVNKRHDLFKQQLQLDVTHTLEQFRNALTEEKMIFGAMQDSRSDSLVQLYGIMIDIGKNGRMLSRPGQSNLAAVVALAQDFLTSLQEFFDVYQKNGIYFSDEFCSAMNTFMTEDEGIVAEITATVGTPAAAFQDEQKKIADIQRSWGTFEMRIPVMIAEMKREFRRLVGGSSKWF
ncbi:hypothetical protein FO488_08000 [Geobacter sp. FeAm09]|uniref:hypothetical protein n=1 Tax=Geobacter sp. FeAm09 TaxID=2597769 RepID=UPI0011ED888F|nr:hypothetical protein [Geobacter sp. FeAm09]QEM68109.1 hypothetical protein FO488_08000 [Geobacter sp. FeAm09]